MLYSFSAGGLLALMTALMLAWKWHLRIVRTAILVVALAVLSSASLGVVGKRIAISSPLQIVLVWGLTLALSFAALAFAFYRDPERKQPEREDAIVSPADGEVLYIRESRDGSLPVSTKHGRNYTLGELTQTPLQSEQAVIIGIGMSFSDVHVNRAPIDGRIRLQRHVPGGFGSLRRPEMVFQNERVTTVIEREGLQVAIVQISSRLVRRIVSFVREGQEVVAGQRIGAIRLGSQVDLVLPIREGLQVTVKPGERVCAGQSIVAVCPKGLAHR